MHRKYRPKTFDEVLGNESLKDSLETTLEYSDHIPHIMFEGERGCGKTSLAHIVAREFGANKHTITDLNCVHFTDVASMRERIDGLGRSSILGSRRVLILDEIHELSDKAQNVLLKPLEELSEDVLVIACTTTTKKVKGTLLDRFVRYKVNPLNVTQSIQLVRNVSGAEGIKLPKPVMRLLVEKTGGNPRRLLTGLTKLVGIRSIEDAEQVLDVLELDSNPEIFDLFKTIFSGLADWSNVSSQLKLILKTNSPSSVRIVLMHLVSSRMMSSWFKPQEGEKLILAYDILKDYDELAEKPSTIVAVYRLHRLFLKGT